MTFLEAVKELDIGHTNAIKCKHLHSCAEFRLVNDEVILYRNDKNTFYHGWHLSIKDYLGEGYIVEL